MQEGFQVTNNQVILLYQLADSDDKEIKRLKATTSGVVKKRLHKAGDVVQKGYVFISKSAVKIEMLIRCQWLSFRDPLMELSACVHTTVIKDMCADCGADLRQDDNVSSE